MYKKCKVCNVLLVKENIEKREHGWIRTECKPCINKKRVARKRRNGTIKEYPCEYCKQPCIKFVKRALCSFKCRILGNIKKENGCWIWLGKKNKQGYGEIMIGGKRRRLTRLVYEFFKEPLIDKLYVCHTCDNPPCINPGHLWQGNNRDNQLDKKRKEKDGYSLHK